MDGQAQIQLSTLTQTKEARKRRSAATSTSSNGKAGGNPAPVAIRSGAGGARLIAGDGGWNTGFTAPTHVCKQFISNGAAHALLADTAPSFRNDTDRVGPPGRPSAPPSSVANARPPAVVRLALVGKLTPPRHAASLALFRQHQSRQEAPFAHLSMHSTCRL
jgi:hypothetical protein